MISIKNISLFLGEEKPKLQVSNFELNSGLWALVGRNGAGKSTFLNALSGINTKFDGDICIDSQSQSTFLPQEMAKRIAVVFSKSEIFGDHTALDVLYLGRIPYQGLMSSLSQRDKEKVTEVIELLGLESLICKQFSVLSDGEKQLIMIGRALVQDTKMILLDEPTAFLDVVNRKKIIKLLAKIVKDQSKLIIFSTHNLGLVEQYCDGMLIIKNRALTLVSSNDESDPIDFKHELEKIFEDEV